MQIFLTLWCFFLVIFQKHINDIISYFLRFVIDCGYVKQRQYNPSSGMYSLDVVQISRYFFDCTLFSVTSVFMSSSYSLQ
jgi:hypothetical protein